MTLFASLAQDYLRLKRLVPTDDPPGRMIALAGDAELDEGNIFEALLEGWKHDVRNLWWIIDYNRQSLDAVVSDRLFGRIDAMFEMMGWRVVTLKYGRLLRGGLCRSRRRIICANGSTPARTRSTRRWSTRAARAGASISAATSTATPGSARSSTTTTTQRCSALMTNLGGHDMDSVLDAFHASRTTGRPASSPTRSRATACPSPGTRTTTPG